MLESWNKRQKRDLYIVLIVLFLMIFVYPIAFYVVVQLVVLIFKMVSYFLS